MTKTTKILLVIFIFSLVIAIGYFGYQYYQNKKISEDNIQDNGWNEYVQFIKSTSKNGIVKSISDNEIIIVSNDEQKEYKFIVTYNTLFEKLGESNENGAQTFVEATINDIKKDDSVWVFFDSSSENQASIIKNTNTNVSYPTPAP